MVEVNRLDQCGYHSFERTPVVRSPRSPHSFCNHHTEADGTLGRRVTEDEATHFMCHHFWIEEAAEATLRAALEKAREELAEIYDLDGEISPSNYDHDDACHLNRQFCYALTIARSALAAIDAALKGEE